LRDLVFGQAKINESLNKNLVANDKILEGINVKVETLSSALKSQLSFNKMIETQLVQIAAAVPVSESGKFPGQPESPIETANMVFTGRGNLPRQTSRTNHAGRYNPPKNDTWDGLVAAIQEDPEVPMISCSIFDQYYEHALCDLGASVNITPMVIYEKLLYPSFSPTYMCVQLTDSKIRYPKEIAKNVLVRVLLRPCRLCGHGYRRRPRNRAHPWATIPEGRQSKDRRRKRRNLLPRWKGEHVLQIQIEGRAAHPEPTG